MALERHILPPWTTHHRCHFNGLICFFKLSDLSPLKLRGGVETSVSWAWCYTPGVPALRRLRQKDHGFKTSLGSVMRTYLTMKDRHCFSACLQGQVYKGQRKFLQDSYKGGVLSKLPGAHKSSFNREGVSLCERKMQTFSESQVSKKTK